MVLSEDESRRRFAIARVARLATVGADGHPHLVPVTFAVDGDMDAADGSAPTTSPRLPEPLERPR